MGLLLKMLLLGAINKAMQSDSASCHALCVPHKGAPACYAVDCGVKFMERTPILAISALIFSGCASIVTWDGSLPSREFLITFHDASGIPIEGIVSSCSGDGIWPSDEMAKEVNSKAGPSNKNGLIRLIHGGYGVGGSYKELGPFTWGHSKSGQVRCEFVYKNRIVESNNINMYNQPVTIVIKNERKI